MSSELGTYPDTHGIPLAGDADAIFAYLGEEAARIERDSKQRTGETDHDATSYDPIAQQQAWVVGWQLADEHALAPGTYDILPGHMSYVLSGMRPSGDPKRAAITAGLPTPDLAAALTWPTPLSRTNHGVRPPITSMAGTPAPRAESHPGYESPTAMHGWQRLGSAAVLRTVSKLGSDAAAIQYLSGRLTAAAAGPVYDPRIPRDTYNNPPALLGALIGSRLSFRDRPQAYAPLNEDSPCVQAARDALATYERQHPLVDGNTRDAIIRAFDDRGPNALGKLSPEAYRQLVENAIEDLQARLSNPYSALLDSANLRHGSPSAEQNQADSHAAAIWNSISRHADNAWRHILSNFTNALDYANKWLAGQRNTLLQQHDIQGWLRNAWHSTWAAVTGTLDNALFARAIYIVALSPQDVPDPFADTGRPLPIDRDLADMDAVAAEKIHDALRQNEIKQRLAALRSRAASADPATPASPPAATTAVRQTEPLLVTGSGPEDPWVKVAPLDGPLNPEPPPNLWEFWHEYDPEETKA